MSDKDVHTEHCDYSHCKYGEEDFCTVYQGIREPSFQESKKPTKAEFKRRQAESDDKYRE